MFVSWVVWVCLLSAHLTTLAHALEITYPTNATNWARDEALRIDWTTNSDDPSTITLMICNLQSNPPFSKTIAEELRTSINSFIVYADASIPAGTGYTVDFVLRTNASDNIMASSAPFSIATAQGASGQNSSSGSNSLFPVIVAVPAVAVVLIIVSCIWFCWFRKRRRQIRADSQSSPYPQRKSSLVRLGHRYQDSSSPLHDAKPDIEERGADEELGEHEAKGEQGEVRRESPLPQPLPQPPPVPVEDTAELPLFVTPRASRQTFNSVRRLRVPAELDTRPRSPRPKSFDSAKVAESRAQSLLPAARRSKLLPLQQILHLKKAAELAGNADLPPHPAEGLVQTGNAVTDQRPARRSKRLSFPQFLHIRRVAELEGSSVLPARTSNASPNTDNEPSDPSSQRSHRLPLHRLLHSRKLAELEANTDVLPVYSRTDLDQKDQVSPPSLPPKDIDVKASLSTPQSGSRSMTPIELDASEPGRLASPSPKRARSRKSPNQSMNGLVGSSSSSVIVSKNQAAREKSDEKGAIRSEESDTLADSRVNQKAESPQTPDAVEFLDLASTESEGDQDENSEGALEADAVPLSRFATSLGSPLMEQTPIDPFLTAEIISAAVEAASRSSPTGSHPEHIAQNGRRGEVARALPTIHEMDAIESAIKRRSKRQSAHSSVRRGEVQKRRPDFVTFKKQMSEAERRAKMIARRRKSRSRLTPKSF